MLWRRGPLGLERPRSVNTEPGGPGAQPRSRAVGCPGQRLRGRLQQLVGNPSGSGQAGPRGHVQAWPGPCAQWRPLRGSWPLGGWTERAAPSGRTGTVGGGGRPSRSSSPRLAVACFQAAADWSPVASTTPTPSSGPEGLPSTRGAFTENGPAPWALSPGSPLGDRPASETPEEARPGQCAKNQHLRSCARMDQRSGASRGMVPAGPSRGSGNPAPPLCRWWRGEPEPDPPEPQQLHALP